MKPRLLILLLIASLLPLAGFAQKAENRRQNVGRPAPDLANEHYGPHERNVLDLWKAKSDTPTPLVVYIHGGAFRAGSKDGYNAAPLLAKGISVMAINYRLSPEFTFPAHYMDCARAIQFARAHAREWNIDPKRIGATGGSAGAGTSLWLGFHDDMADPKNPDPILRESTRLSCMAVVGAQSSYDPFVIKEWVGEAASRHPAFEGFYGLKPEEYGAPEAREMLRKASPITWLTRDDPPIIAFYSEARALPPPHARPGAGIHHINFGLKLKEQMDQLGIECTIRHADEKPDVAQEMVGFFVKHLSTKPRS